MAFDGLPISDEVDFVEASDFFAECVVEIGSSLTAKTVHLPVRRARRIADFWTSGAKLTDFWTTFGPIGPLRSGAGRTSFMKTKGINGGRAGTRTPDLLRVKQAL